MVIDYRKFAKFALRLGSVLVVVSVLVWGFHFLRTSSVTVLTTSSDSTVSIYPIRNHTISGSAVAHGSATFTAHLSAGSYAVTVAGQNSSVVRIISLGWRQNMTYSLGPPVFLSTEAVASRNAADLSANSSSLYFLNPDTSNLQKITSQNLQVPIAPNINFTSVQWFSTGYGVGQDSSGKLYVIQHDSAHQLAAPKSVRFFATTPDQHIYLATTHDLYYGSPSGTFQKIYALRSGLTAMVASSSSVTLLYKSSVQMVTPQGRPTKSAALQLSTGSWSPDGTKFATISSAGGQIFDNNLHTLTPLPGDTPSNVAWLDNNTLLYGVGSELWQFSLTNHLATTVASPDSSADIVSLAVDAPNHAVYLSTLNSDSSSVLYRVWLNNKQPALAAARLSQYFPQNVGECYAEFINFTQPSLSLTSGDPSPAACAPDITAILQSVGLATDAVQINRVYIPLSERQGP